MSIVLGPGVVLGAGIQVGTEGAEPPPPPPPPGPPAVLSTANIYYPMQDIIGSAANGTSVAALTNYGTDGATYAATNYGGWTAPTVATQNTVKVLSFNISASNQYGYDIANTFPVTSGSLFVVGWSYGSRFIGFGGTGSYHYSFFGWSAANNGNFLFRDISDTGADMYPTYSSAALQVFGIVKTGSTVVYYDNTTTPVTYGSPVTGTYGYNAIGFRSSYAGQTSTGYLGDLVYFNTALSNSDAGDIITYLKTIYNIA